MGNTNETLRIVSFKLPASLDRQLTAMAAKRGASRSAVVREALHELARAERGSFIKAAGHLIGCVKGGPDDLSSNPDHMADFGK
jgi:Arc/MetJ-type ribon-helix-helix transcriptional regulator